MVAFRPADGGVEHLAIIIGQPNRNQPVVERVAHVTAANRHNAFYLETKARRSGHLF